MPRIANSLVVRDARMTIAAPTTGANDRHFPPVPLTLLCVLVVTQTAHFFEHVVQMVQVHVYGLSGQDAQGLVGRLDVEWVHFVWNSAVLLAVLLLLRPLRRNPWLRLAAPLVGWHAGEHGYILWVYLSTGAAGTPGLLSSGGLIAGGLPLARPDLHFLYNLLETIPLIAALRHFGLVDRPRVHPATD